MTNEGCWHANGAGCDAHVDPTARPTWANTFICLPMYSARANLSVAGIAEEIGSASRTGALPWAFIIRSAAPLLVMSMPCSGRFPAARTVIVMSVR